MPLKLIEQRDFIRQKSFKIMFCMQLHKIFVGAVSIIRKQIKLLQVILSRSQKSFVAVEMFVIHKGNIVCINKKTGIYKNTKFSIMVEMTLIQCGQTYQSIIVFR